MKRREFLWRITIRPAGAALYSRCFDTDLLRIRQCGLGTSSRPFRHKLSARKEGRRILSGQFTDFGDGANLRVMERIQERTGCWPGLIGVDYADFGRGSLTYKTPNRVAIEYWKQGGLVTVPTGETTKPRSGHPALRLDPRRLRPGPRAGSRGLCHRGWAPTLMT